jgi:hypothetical protein
VKLKIHLLLLPEARGAAITSVIKAPFIWT